MKLIILTLLWVIIYSESHNITDIVYFRCNDSIIDCSNHGICNNDQDDCICFGGYISYFEDGNYYTDKARCNYKQRNQIYALALSLFVTFGSMHFYLGNYIIGYIQMILFAVILTYNIIAIYYLSVKHMRPLTPIQLKQSLCVGMFIIFSCFLFLMWYLFDTFMIIFGIYRDENNVEMHETIL
jgi:hypothetical protein